MRFNQCGKKNKSKCLIPLNKAPGTLAAIIIGTIYDNIIKNGNMC